MKTPTSSRQSSQVLTQVEIDRYVAQAHQMRAEFIAASLKSGFVRLRAVFSRKTAASKATA